MNEKFARYPAGISNLASKLGQIGAKWDKSDTFKIRFITFWLAELKCIETDLKKSQICPICGQSDPILTSLDWTLAVRLDAVEV